MTKQNYFRSFFLLHLKPCLPAGRGERPEIPLATFRVGAKQGYFRSSLSSYILSALGCILIFFSTIGCSDNAKKKETPISYLQENAKLFSKKLDLKEIREVSLNQEAEEATSTWMAYLLLKSEIGNFRSMTLKDLANNGNNLVRITKKLMDSIPGKFNTIPVQSRIAVLFTHAKVLQQETKRQKIDADKIQRLGGEIYGAFTNLNIQLNEVFLQHFPKFDMDQKQDSLQKAEKAQRKPKATDQKSLDKKPIGLKPILHH